MAESSHSHSLTPHHCTWPRYRASCFTGGVFQYCRLRCQRQGQNSNATLPLLCFFSLQSRISIRRYILVAPLKGPSASIALTLPQAAASDIQLFPRTNHRILISNRTRQQRHLRLSTAAAKDQASRLLDRSRYPQPSVITLSRATACLIFYLTLTLENVLKRVSCDA